MSLKDKTKLVIVFLALGLLVQLYWQALDLGLLDIDVRLTTIFRIINLGSSVSLLIFFLAILKKQKD